MRETLGGSIGEFKTPHGTPKLNVELTAVALWAEEDRPPQE